MADPMGALRAAGARAFEYGTTAIDRYLGLPRAPVGFIAVEAGIVDLARIFDGLEYPGLPYADASLGAPAAGGASAAGGAPASPVPQDAMEYRFLCVDSTDATGLGASPATDFRRDPVRGFFRDPAEVRRSLRKGLWPAPDPSHPDAVFESAVLWSRAGVCAEAPDPARFVLPSSLPQPYERDLLTLILTGKSPARGFDFLLATGFIDKFWPEIAGLVRVDHAKDHHPEGGGWAHTMETFSHRKAPDLVLSLALLLHDTGKAHSAPEAGKKFHRHAEIGASMARRFLTRLGFDAETVRDVEYLIRSHMLPAALPRLPLARVGEVVADPRFPLLLELYRCDEFSSYKGPDGYHEACAAYRAYLRNSRNPYRDAGGKKLTGCGTAPTYRISLA